MSSDSGRGIAPLENRLLRARSRGEISTDDAFEALFREYARTVTAWLAARVESGVVDDLAQDVWLIFYGRFRSWKFGIEMESVEARPVLSFLFRTCQFVARGHRRLASTRMNESLEDAKVEPANQGASSDPAREIEASRSLAIARRVCSEEEFDVLLAKLAGMTGREIAATLSLTEAVVDHRYRNALSHLRKELRVGLD